MKSTTYEINDENDEDLLDKLLDDSLLKACQKVLSRRIKITTESLKSEAGRVTTTLLFRRSKVKVYEMMEDESSQDKGMIAAARSRLCNSVPDTQSEYDDMAAEIALMTILMLISKWGNIRTGN